MADKRNYYEKISLRNKTPEEAEKITKLFNDNIDVVFGALEKDVLTRTVSQDYAINIVIGAGQYKSHLSQGGVEIFQNIFSQLKNSKKSIYIMVDNYDNLRSLKLETWFSDYSTTSGIWLGPGFSSQSLFESEPIRSEDKKLNFTGLSFVVEDGKYKVIKTLMDEDS